ncbi:histone-fold-containing protein [Russula ochroleuca]|uniref:Histone-fold-containing protein n=1 Tax=Russula ochroleuca TaxID=152965 RepID=A0A9P5T7Q6_9AGAM|nr:histone-fold-containing protein [Russula ochroleuca]
MSDAHMEIDDVDQANNDTPPPPEDKPSDQPKGKAATKPTASLVREPGKSLLPISRVQKIMKADKELPMVAKEAAFLISLATEEFIKRLSEASYHIAHREKRVTVQQRDIASVTRRADEFLFLEEIIPWPDASDAPARRKLQGPVKSTGTSTGGNRSISEFVTSTADAEAKSHGVDVVMNEDGTMQVVAEDDDSEDI